MMEVVQRSIGVQVNLCNCHCLLGQSVSSLPPRSPRGANRSRHHFSFNKALSVDTSHPSEISAFSRHIASREGSWDNGGPSFGSSFSSSHRSGTDQSTGNYTHSFHHYSHGSGGGGGAAAAAGGNSVNSSSITSSSRTARSSVSEMDSVSEADENNKLLEVSNNESSLTEASTMEPLEDSDNNALPDHSEDTETTRLLQDNTNNADDGSGTNLASENQTGTTNNDSGVVDRLQHQAAAEILNKKESHAYHFKRKYNFRSDSVFSDVMPMPASSSGSETPKSPENREKSGSLSSLKGQTSKWASLRKKLGRLNSSSSSSEKHQLKALEQQAHQFQRHHQNQQNQEQQPQQQQQQKQPPKSAKTALEEKRSLLQRAKTLSILPVNRNKEDVVKKQPKEIPKPPELFNVGGEMNMIPLELLIDINDLKRPQ